MRQKYPFLMLIAATAVMMAAAGCGRPALPAADPVPGTEAGGVHPCTLNAAFLADVSVPPGSQLLPQTGFQKIWRVRNSGTCDWQVGTQLVYISGAAMGSTRVVSVPPLATGASTEVGVNFVSPATPGTYNATWRMRGPDGTLFGAEFPLSLVVSRTPDLIAGESTALPVDEPTATPEPPWGYRQGDQGPVVSAIQYLLRAEGYTLVADGVFGPITDTEVRDFQITSHLTGDGVVGPVTWAALVKDNTVQQGSRGDAVRAAQYLLVHLYGYDIPVDGDFEATTRVAVLNFQSDYVLGFVDGVVRPNTWNALIGVP